MGKTRVIHFSYFFYIGLIVWTSACKRTGKTVPDEQGYEDQLVVQLTIRIEQDDNLELYFRKGKETYDSERRLAVKVKGSQESQKVDFVFDILEFPTHVRIDLGENPKQPNIKIEKLAFKYNKAEHVFTPEELKKYFKPNPWLQFDFETLSGKGKVLDGKYDPFLSSNEISYFVNKLILY